MKMWRTRGAFF